MFTFTRKQLEDVLRKVCKVTNSNSHLPALKQVKVTSTPEGMLFTCTDFDISLRTCLSALEGEPSEEASICVPAQVLQKVVRAPTSQALRSGKSVM